MDVHCLEPDELTVEFEIRQLTAGPTNLELLHAKVQAEESFPILIPKTPHLSGIRHPDTEIRLCSLKLSRTSAFLDSNPALSEPIIRQLRSRLCHIRGRLFRLHHQHLAPDKVEPVAAHCEELLKYVEQIQTSCRVGTEDSGDKPRKNMIPSCAPKHASTSNVQFQSDFNLDSAIPALDTTPRLEPKIAPQVVRETSSRGNLLDLFSSAENPTHPVTTSSTDPGMAYMDFLRPSVDQSEIPTTNLKESPTDPAVNPVTQTDVHSVVNTFGSMLLDFRRSLVDSSRPTPTNYNTAERFTSNRLSLPNSINMSRILLGWNLKFSGSKDDMPIERFVGRIDQMSKCSGINLNDCVQNMTCLMSGVALEWFWMTMERDPDVTWDRLKPALLQRFNRGITNREIRRMLDDRKQKYPQECYGDFQDAILQIGLQGVPPIPDNELLDVLLNNMRPGLQLALAGKYVYNIGQLAQEARYLETLWKQIKFNPEANIGASRSVLHELNTPDNTSVAHATDIDTVCVFDRTKEQTGRNPITTRDNTTFHCWNCKSPGHTFQLCRQPRTIFCYGCGRTDTYLPDCSKCQNTSSGNLPMRERFPRDPLLQSPNIPSKILTSETASNTDPELYSRQRRKFD